MALFGYKNFWILILLKICTSASITNEDLAKILGTRTDVNSAVKDEYPSMTDMRLAALSNLRGDRRDKESVFDPDTSDAGDGLAPLKDPPFLERLASSSDVIRKSSTFRKKHMEKSTPLPVECSTDWIKQSRDILSEDTRFFLECVCRSTARMNTDTAPWNYPSFLERLTSSSGVMRQRSALKKKQESTSSLLPVKCNADLIKQSRDILSDDTLSFLKCVCRSAVRMNTETVKECLSRRGPVGRDVDTNRGSRITFGGCGATKCKRKMDRPTLESALWK